mmetsp:Transcript_17190/g.35728  ORF Transcript_17190/g.35728 Transcript_17190/m.35728 type:complete len:87 (+) Transcript_17190:2513-2773(+)
MCKIETFRSQRGVLSRSFRDFIRVGEAASYARTCPEMDEYPRTFRAVPLNSPPPMKPRVSERCQHLHRLRPTISTLRSAVPFRKKM